VNFSSSLALSGSQLRTCAWYGDRPFSLDFPDRWDVTFLWPKTPPPITDYQIVDSLARPVGQPPIREICRGKSRPLVIVDDLNRPTPAVHVIPHLLKHFHDAGIPAGNVRILMAPGTHGTPVRDAMAKKVGIEAASSCRVLLHDCTRNLVRIGETSYGTPVIVNRDVMASDFVVGIGGIYPNYTAGFGGGSKLALGVLGKRSIMHLHYRYRSIGWGSSGQSDIRRDLDEIAQMIGLNTMISLHVNADRDVVRVTCGDHFQYYGQALAFSKEAFRSPMPGDADVVISNAYPEDLSLTFVRMKGTTPLIHCAPGSSRIVIASCSEGIGHHGLFPLVNLPRFHRERVMARRIFIMKPEDIVHALISRLRRSLNTKTVSPQKNPIWLCQTGDHPEGLPSQVPFQIRVVSSWSEILRAVQTEQGGGRRLDVVVYPCAPLQWLDPSMTREESSVRNSTLQESVEH